VLLAHAHASLRERIDSARAGLICPMAALPGRTASGGALQQ
jgi:hypothetical protein